MQNSTIGKYISRHALVLVLGSLHRLCSYYLDLYASLFFTRFSLATFFLFFLWCFNLSSSTIKAFKTANFNKAITLSNIERYEEAIICSQKSVSFNPQHASSHNSLGRLLCVSENRIPAILALSRFLILEPQTNRAKDNLELLQYVMKANVEKTGKNTINVNINPNMLSDTTEDGKIKENNFATTDLLLTMETALDYDKKPKKKTEVKKFIEKIELVCSSLKESKNENYGFYWDYYVPYFIEMQDGKFIKTFAHIAFATSGYPDVDKWLKKHEKDINNFYEWSSNFNWQQNGK